MASCLHCYVPVLYVTIHAYTQMYTWLVEYMASQQGQACDQ